MAKTVRYIWRVRPHLDKIRDVVREIEAANWRVTSGVDEKKDGKPFCHDIILEAPEDEKELVEEKAIILVAHRKLKGFHRDR